MLNLRNNLLKRYFKWFIASKNQLYYTFLMDSDLQTSIQVWTEFCDKRIRDSVARGLREDAMNYALEWCSFIQERYKLPQIKNWKIFKRHFTEKLFGRVENCKFSPGWKVSNVIEYLSNFNNRDCHIAIFQEGDGSGSRNLILQSSQYSSWSSLVSSIPNSHYIEAFPESSTKDSLCYRRLATEFGFDVYYEVGLGQARMLFETQQKSSLIYTISIKGGRLNFIRMPKNKSKLKIGQELIHEFILNQEQYFQAKCRHLIYFLDINWISIEGYYYPENPSKVHVVDIDIPFDKLFNH